MTRKRDIIFDSPDSVENLFRKAGETKSSREWKKQLEDGPHPTQEILFDYAVENLPEAKRDQLFEHIAHCLRCTEEVYSIRAKARKLGGVIKGTQTRKQGNLDQDDWASSRVDIRLEEQTSQPTDLYSGQRILAIRVANPASQNGRYWVPLLFEELKRGRARFSWSVPDAKSGSPTAKPRLGFGRARGDHSGHPKSLLRIHPSDLLIYVDMPKKGKSTIVEITGHYRSGDVWDPGGRGGATGYLPCSYRGTFDNESHYVSNELFDALRGRRPYWDLTNMREHVAGLLSKMSLKGPGPSSEE